MSTMIEDEYVYGGARNSEVLSTGPDDRTRAALLKVVPVREQASEF